MRKIRIIVVDDDPDMVDITSEYLEKFDIDVVGIGYDGKDAVTLYQSLKPDVILLDMKMPEYDGMYAIEKIKKEDPHAKFIIISGYIDDYHFNENEIVGILRKPFNIDQLKKTIDLIRKN